MLRCIFFFTKKVSYLYWRRLSPLSIASDNLLPPLRDVFPPKGRWFTREYYLVFRNLVLVVILVLESKAL